VLSGKNILLGVTGSVAAYKSIDIARRLIDEGASVKALLTDAACRFITPYALETVTGNPAYTDLFKDPFSHIKLPGETDLLLIAPATANTINKFASGIADNLLSNIWLVFEGTTVMAPAMNYRMFRNPIVKKNIRELSGLGVRFAGPVSGVLACGEEGAGRMADTSEIVEAVIAEMTPGDLKGHRILVTAGPTIEMIDPVRYISNRSSGKMGYATARAACRRGASVTLISGPSSERPPEGVSFISVQSAYEMETAVLKKLKRSTSLIMAAAVSDFMPSNYARTKNRKADIDSLKLKKTADILKKAGAQKGKRVIIGFAAETGSDIKSARMKLKGKDLDLIVMNDVSRKDAGFEVDTNIVTIIDKKGKAFEYPLMKKYDVANVILDRLIKLSPRRSS
jgi:phosphopantothenoylcysteine decarboxylase/phosphopantothenate--cysteine ligase